MMASSKEETSEWMVLERQPESAHPSIEDMGFGLPQPAIVYTMTHPHTRIACLRREANGKLYLRVNGFNTINTCSGPLDQRVFRVAGSLGQSSVGGEIDAATSEASMKDFRAFDTKLNGKHKAMAYGQQVAGLLKHIAYESWTHVVQENGLWDVYFEGVKMTASGNHIAETVKAYVQTHNDLVNDPDSFFARDDKEEAAQFIKLKLSQMLKGKKVKIAKLASRMSVLKDVARTAVAALQAQEQDATTEAEVSPEPDQTVQSVSVHTMEQIHPHHTLAGAAIATQNNNIAMPTVVKSPQSPTVHSVESTESTNMPTDQRGEKADLYKAPVPVHRDALVHDHVHRQQPGLITEAQTVSRKRKATDELPEGDFQAYRSPKSRKTSNDDFARAPVDSASQPPAAVAAVQHSGVEAASGSLHSGSASSNASSSPVSVFSNGTLAHPGNLSQSSTATSVSTLWPPRIPNSLTHRDLFRGPRIVNAPRHIRGFPIPINKDLRKKVLAGELHTENVAGLDLWLQIHCFQTEGLSSHQIFNTVASYILNTPQFENEYYGAPVPAIGPYPPLPQAQVTQMGQPVYSGPQQQAHTQPAATQSNGIANVPTTQAKAKAPTPTLRELADTFVRTGTLTSYTVPQLKDFFRKVCNDTLNTRTAKKDHWMTAIKSDAKVMREVAKIEAENQLAQDQLVQQYQQQSQQPNYQQPQSTYPPRAHQPPQGQQMNYQQPEGSYQPQVHQPPQGYQGPQGYQQQGQDEYFTRPNDQHFTPGQQVSMGSSEPSRLAQHPNHQAGRSVAPPISRNAHNSHLGGPMSQRAGVKKQPPQTRPAFYQKDQTLTDRLYEQAQHDQTPDVQHQYSGIPNAVNHALPPLFRNGIYVGPMGEQRAQTYEVPHASQYPQQSVSIPQVSSNEVVDLTDELADGLGHQAQRQASPPKYKLPNGDYLPTESSQKIETIDEKARAQWNGVKRARQLQKPVNKYAQRGPLIDKDPNTMSSASGINKVRRYKARGGEKASARPVPNQSMDAGTQEASMAEQHAIGSSNDQFAYQMPPMPNQYHGMQNGYLNQFNNFHGVASSSENTFPDPSPNHPEMFPQDGPGATFPEYDNNHFANQMSPMLGQNHGMGTVPANQLNNLDGRLWADDSIPDPTYNYQEMLPQDDHSALVPGQNNDQFAQNYGMMTAPTYQQNYFADLPSQPEDAIPDPSYNHQEMFPQNGNWVDPDQGIDPSLLNL